MNDDRLEDLVAEFVERREDGESVDPSAFAAEHPSAEGLLEALTEALGAEALFPSGVSQIDRPEHIGTWRVLRELGRGGGGRVFEVVHDDRPGQYALKLLNLAAVGNPRALERFQREGKVLTALDHPGIVRVHEVSGEGELPYIVMDLLPGQALSQRLMEARRELRTSRADRTPPTDALRLPGDGDTISRATYVVARLARAVHYAHERGLLHRDLKPSNVLLDAEGEPVLVDFGLAVSDESATLTESGDLLGTPHYMAPEQARGERADARTDVYGLAAVLYELLTLRPPHQGRDPLEVLQAIRTRPHVPVRRLNPTVPPALARVVDRALAWRRARRTRTAEALALDLEAALVGAPIHARRRGPVERAEDLIRFKPRSVALTAVSGLVLILVLVLAMGSDPDRLPRIRAANSDAQAAWFESDEEQLAEHARTLDRLLPGDPRAALYRAHAAERIAALTGDPAVDAVIEALTLLDQGEQLAAVKALHRAHNAAPSWALPMGIAGMTDTRGEERADVEVAEGQEVPRIKEEEDRARRISDLSIARGLLPQSMRLTRELAFHLRHAGRAKEGRVLLEALVAGDRGDWHEWSELAVCRLEADDPEEAFEAIEEALRRKTSGDKSAILQRKASILDALGERAESEALFRSLIALFPEDAQLRFNLGLVLDRECQLKEAMEAYKQAVELNPEDMKAIVTIAHMYAGSGLFNPVPCEKCRAAYEANPELRDADKALEWVERAVIVDGCETDWVPTWAASTGGRIDRVQEVHDILERQVDPDKPVDERVVRIERALRELRRELERRRGNED